MYNSSTAEKIKNIPSIGDINIERLPQDLTKIYAQIISLRRQVAEGTLNLQDDELVSSILYLQKLSHNLETILLVQPDHVQKDSIAFVAGTANNLIYKIGLFDDQSNSILGIDSISPFISSIILFLIGNSQADAAEMSISLPNFTDLNVIQIKLINNIAALAKGNLNIIINEYFTEEEVIESADLEEIALNYLWRELGLGIKNLAINLTSITENREKKNHFQSVIDLSISQIEAFKQNDVYAGPYRLAKLLKILEEDILNRAVINIPPPNNVDLESWSAFLKKLAQDRPYLWEKS